MWVRRLGVADRINIKENRVFNTWLGQEILLAIKLASKWANTMSNPPEALC